MLLHRLVLWAPRGAEARGRRGPGGRAAQQGELVRDRISAAWQGELETLRKGAPERGEEARRRRTGGKLEGEARAREVLRRVGLGEYSKGASLLARGRACWSTAAWSVLPGARNCMITWRFVDCGATGVLRAAGWKATAEETAAKSMDLM